jgi:hypothetical protein
MSLQKVATSPFDHEKIRLEKFKVSEINLENNC